MKAKQPAKPTNEFAEGLSQPALRALEAGGYTKLEQLTKVTEAEVANLHGMGPKGIRLLNSALQAKGWSFKSKS
jgi:hypothetical protein